MLARFTIPFPTHVTAPLSPRYAPCVVVAANHLPKSRAAAETVDRAGPTLWLGGNRPSAGV